MIDLPRRQFLTTQAAASIRRGIAEGAWNGVLPSERRLCALLRVSRPTVQSALRLLAKDGWIEIRPQRCARLKRRRPAPRAHGRLVGLVLSEPTSHMALHVNLALSDIRAHLGEQGFTTEILVCQGQSARVQQRKLELLLARERVSACVLLSASRELQRWVSAQPVPALVLGSCHPAVALASLDCDYRSLCRHAAGVLLKKGHRRLAFLSPDSEVAGHLASEQGFSEGVAQYGRGNARGLIVRHNGTPQQIIARLDALFDSGRPPTALLVSTQEYVFSVLLYLLKRGLKVPDAVSLIARDNDYFFEKVTPAITRYAVGLDGYTHRVSRLVLQMVEQGHLSPRPHFIFPRFVAGATVRQLR